MVSWTWYAVNNCSAVLELALWVVTGLFDSFGEQDFGRDGHKVVPDTVDGEYSSPGHGVGHVGKPLLVRVVQQRQSGGGSAEVQERQLRSHR